MSSSRSILQIRAAGIVVVGYVSRVLREKIADDLVDRVVAFLLERIIHSGKRALPSPCWTRLPDWNFLVPSSIFGSPFRSYLSVFIVTYSIIQKQKSKALSAQNSHENFFRLWHTLYGEGKGDGVLRAVIFQQPRQLLCVIERNAVRKCLLLGGWQRTCVDACAQDRAIALPDDKPVISLCTV